MNTIRRFIKVAAAIIAAMVSNATKKQRPKIVTLWDYQRMLAELDRKIAVMEGYMNKIIKQHLSISTMEWNLKITSGVLTRIALVKKIVAFQIELATHTEWKHEGWAEQQIIRLPSRHEHAPV